MIRTKEGKTFRSIGEIRVRISMMKGRNDLNHLSSRIDIIHINKLIQLRMGPRLQNMLGKELGIK